MDLYFFVISLLMFGHHMKEALEYFNGVKSPSESSILIVSLSLKHYLSNNARNILLSDLITKIKF